MDICRFDVNVPNPGPQAVVAELALEKGSTDELVALGFPIREQGLEILDLFLGLDPCAEEGADRLDLKLEPNESMTVYVGVRTNGGPGAAIVHLVDRRGDQVGGVMLACTEGLDNDPAGQLITPEVPCPIVLSGSPHPFDGDDPSKENPGGLVTGGWAQVAFPLLNPTADTLHGATAYLEHLGYADGTIEPGTWQLGDFAPGETFMATWRIRIDSTTRPVEPCVVVGADKFDPVRLRAEIPVHGEPPWWERPEHGRKRVRDERGHHRAPTRAVLRAAGDELESSPPES
jgi:hypothetical protein